MAVHGLSACGDKKTSLLTKQSAVDRLVAVGSFVLAACQSSELWHSYHYRETKIFACYNERLAFKPLMSRSHSLGFILVFDVNFNQNMTRNEMKERKCNRIGRTSNDLFHAFMSPGSIPRNDRSNDVAHRNGQQKTGSASCF